MVMRHSKGRCASVGGCGVVCCVVLYVVFGGDVKSCVVFSSIKGVRNVSVM